MTNKYTTQLERNGFHQWFIYENGIKMAELGSFSSEKRALKHIKLLEEKENEVGKKRQDKPETKSKVPEKKSTET